MGKELKKIKSMMFFSNGNVATFDDNGQVPALQKSLVEMVLDNCKANGYDPDGLIIETQWGLTYRIEKTDGGHNWSVI